MEKRYRLVSNGLYGHVLIERDKLMHWWAFRLDVTGGRAHPQNLPPWAIKFDGQIYEMTFSNPKMSDNLE
jgi:hypothetical protein